jgi:GR25 family glycosyltransferase involved in LPS biosynthesis
MGRNESVPFRVKVALLIIWPVHAVVRRLASFFQDFQTYLSNKEVALLPPAPVLDLNAAGFVPILTTRHCLFIAQRLASMLKSVGVRSELIFDRPPQGFSPYPHIVICPQMFTNLPAKYFAFQMEQSVNPRWFTKSYFKSLRNAVAVFDYNMTNLAYLERQRFDWKKIYYMPITADPQLISKQPELESTEYDVVFYGDDNNPRRRRFLDALRKLFSVKVINNLFGEKLYKELKKAKVLVNIHYYENALLETTRLAEALSQGAIIISETSTDIDEYRDLHKVVDFVPLNDVAAMVERVAHWVNNDTLRHQAKSMNQEFLTKAPDLMEFYFMRFLLAQNVIGFDAFYQRCSRHINISSFMCLGLPEVQSRRHEFLKLKRPEIRYFSGLRHQKGWIGCALSYKFLMLRARDQGLEDICICEDDVELPTDWDQKIESVYTYLRERAGQWHIFSGLMAVIHKDLKVKRVEDFSGLTFAHVDRMMSTVFNIYSRRVFDVFSRWDESDEDANRNTIDKFIERQPDLEIVTTRPFLVGHKPESHSTLWGINNQQYDPMIAKSSVDLSRRVDEFLVQKD